MDDKLRNLKGSAFRDEFKYQHKQKLNVNFMACDADLFLVDKNLHGVIALLDIKNEETGDTITESETIVYDHEIEHGVDVYIIYTTPTFDVFTIYQYKGDCNSMPVVASFNGWEEFNKWEGELRQRWFDPRYRKLLDKYA